MSDLAKNENYVQELFQSDAVQDLTPTEKQDVLTSLLKYNMLYLEQNSETLEQENEDYATEPDCTFDKISPSGDFTIYFNVNLAGPSFMKQLYGSTMKG